MKKKQAEIVFDSMFATEEEANMQITILKIVDYKGSKIYIRRIDAGEGVVFEYLFIYKNEIYGFSRKVLPEKEKLSGEELGTGIGMMVATATATIDTLLDQKDGKKGKQKD